MFSLIQIPSTHEKPTHSEEVTERISRREQTLVLFVRSIYEFTIKEEHDTINRRSRIAREKQAENVKMTLCTHSLLSENGSCGEGADPG